MCERCDAELAAIEADVATLELDALERDLDVAAGLIPSWAQRAMFPHERRARVNFAAMASAVDRHADRLVELVTGHRAFIAQAVEDRLNTADTSTQLARVVAGIADPARNITADVPGYRAATAEVQAQAQATLEAAYREARASVRAEAIAQGVPHEALDPGVIGRDAATVIAGHAEAVADAPGRVVTQAVTAAATRQASGLPVDKARAGLVDAARNGLNAGLVTDAARVPAQQVSAAGRVDALGDLPAAASYYASELLDGNTCDPCSLIDGTSYATLDDAEADYGSGTYVDCDGGDRCRGTLVTVWDTENAPTVNDVGGDGGGDGAPAEPTAPAPVEPPPRTSGDASTRPAGTIAPADALTLPANLPERARATLDALGQVLGLSGDGGIRVKADVVWRKARPGQRRGGSFTPRDRAGRAVLTVSDKGDGAELNALLHEFGHSIDVASSQGRGSWLSELVADTRPELNQAYRDFLVAARATPTISGAADRYGYAGPAYVRYYRDPTEVWARAFSQWAANTIGGDARASLEAVTVGYQWTDAEFAGLSPLVETILRLRGMIA